MGAKRCIVVATAVLSRCSVFGLDRTEWDAGDMRLAVDGRGRVVRMIDENTGRDCGADVIESFLLSAQVDSILHFPQSFVWDPEEGAAKPEDFGSTLQAYCRNRSTARVIENWNHDFYSAPAYDDGGVAGSKIALFGSTTAEALETIGRIEIEEGLPHPTIDGRWGKTARSASAAYLILDFGEDDIDEAIAWTKRAGLRQPGEPSNSTILVANSRFGG